MADLHATGRLTAAIVRPSVIGSNAYGPSAGYFGNTAGPTALTLAFASGMARFTCLNPDHVRADEGVEGARKKRNPE